MKMFRMISGRSLAAVGLLVTLACSLAGQQLAQLPGLSLIGALVLALLLGMVLQGARSLRDAAQTSTPFIANKFLRAGIILLGFKLNLVLLMGAGIKSLFAAIFLVTVMVSLNYVVARKFFGVEHTLALLTACGSSICGAAAVMGVSGAAKAKTDDSVLAVACVAILVGVIEAHRSAVAKKDAILAGADGVDVELNTTAAQGGTAKGGFLSHFQNPIPWFMGGFLLASAIGSFVPAIADYTGTLVTIAYLLLGMAMAALGLNVNFSVVAKKGAKPLASAGLCSVVLVLLSYGIVEAFF